MELYGTMHIIKALLDWHEINMSLELEQDDDTGNILDIFVFEDDYESITVQVPTPLGQKIFRDFLGYAATTISKEDDDEDTY